MIVFLFYLQFCPQRLHIHIKPLQQDRGLMLQLLAYNVQIGHLLRWSSRLYQREKRPDLQILDDKISSYFRYSQSNFIKL